MFNPNISNLLQRVLSHPIMLKKYAWLVLWGIIIRSSSNSSCLKKHTWSFNHLHKGICNTGFSYCMKQCTQILILALSPSPSHWNNMHKSIIFYIFPIFYLCAQSSEINDNIQYIFSFFFFSFFLFFLFSFVFYSFFTSFFWRKREERRQVRERERDRVGENVHFV